MNINMSSLSIVSKELGHTIVKNSPTILTALGVGGMLTTVIFAVQGTFKAAEILEREAIFIQEQRELVGYELDWKDKIELSWQCYIPTAAMGLTSIICVIAANHIGLRRNAALASLYTLADTTLREYQAKVVETIGEKKEQSIQDEMAQDTLNKHPVKNEGVILTGNGDYLCFDNFSKRYFRSNVTKVQRAEALFNQKLNREGWLNINYLYDLLDLEGVELGEEYGWVADRELLEFKFSTRLAKDTEEPTLVVDYRASPRHI